MRQMITLFRKRFVQRTDCYSLQNGDETAQYRVVRKTLTDDIIASHLSGEITVGLYPSADSTTKWLCIDIDNLDECAVREPQNHARRFNIPYLTEFSGKKGYHLWVFFDKPYSNRIARAFATAFAFNNEVFPKQDNIPDGKLGNLIKAPLGLHRATGKRCLFLGHDLQPESDQYATLSTIRCVDPIQILRSNMPEIWSELVRDNRNDKSTNSTPNMIRMPLLKDCVREAIMTGTTQGQRNRTGHIIASELRNSGIRKPFTEDLLTQIWNQRNEPPLELREVELIIDSAYGKKRYTYGCRESGPLRELLNCIGLDNCLYAGALRTMTEQG